MIDIKARSFTAATFNIKGWSEAQHDGINAWVNRAPLTLTTISRMGADCLGLQEFSANNNVQFYGNNLPGFVLHLGAEMSNGRFNPIAYNPRTLTIQDSGVIWLSQTDEPKPDWGAQHIRSASIVVFEYCPTQCVSGERVLFVNAHLDHQSELARVEGTKKILQKLSRYHCPIVAVGDYNASFGHSNTNASYTSMPYDLFLQAGFQDAFMTANPDAVDSPPPTFHNFKGKDYSPSDRYGTRHIDWIMCKGLQTQSSSIIYDSQPQPPHYPSDHYPKVAKLKFRIAQE